MLALLPTDGRDPLVRISETAEPVPGPDQAIVEVGAFSINRGETFLLERPTDGWRPGKDVAGVVVRAADDGTGPAVGERVVGHPSHSGWAQRVAVTTDALAPVPAGVELERAAALPLAGLTALRLLRVTGPLAGLRVLMTAASGGVGHYFTELAAGAGAELTVLSASPQRAQRLLELGATQAVYDLADARGPYDVILDGVGGEVLSRSLSLLRTGGRLVWYGQASRTPARLDFFDYFEQTGATIRHFHYEDSAIPVARDLATLVRLVAAGRLHPEIGLLADWHSTATALAELRDRTVRGNAVMRVAPDHQTARDQTSSQLPAHTDSTEIISRYVAALQEGDERTIRDSFAEHASWTLRAGDLPISGTWSGRDAVIDEFLGAALSYYEPGSITIEVTGMIADGDQIVLQWTTRARTRAGLPYENDCIGVFTIKDGKIEAVREYMDTLYAHDRAFATSTP